MAFQRYLELLSARNQTAPRPKHITCPRGMLIHPCRWKIGYVQPHERTCSSSIYYGRKFLCPPYSNIPSQPPLPPNLSPTTPYASLPCVMPQLSLHLTLNESIIFLLTSLDMRDDSLKMARLDCPTAATAWTR